MTNWIEHLKVGDKVIVNSRYQGRMVGSVEKINKATIKVAGVLFNKDGFQRGGGWLGATLSECTPDTERAVLDEREKMRLVRYFERKVWSNESLDRLRKFYKLDKEV